MDQFLRKRKQKEQTEKNRSVTPFRYSFHYFYKTVHFTTGLQLLIVNWSISLSFCLFFCFPFFPQVFPLSSLLRAWRTVVQFELFFSTGQSSLLSTTCQHSKQTIMTFSRVTWQQRELRAQHRSDVPIHEHKYEEQKVQPWKCLPSWHMSFFQPGGHMHEKVLLPSGVQVPPFLQGLLRHGSISEKEKKEEIEKKISATPFRYFLHSFYKTVNFTTGLQLLIVNWSISLPFRFFFCFPFFPQFFLFLPSYMHGQQWSNLNYFFLLDSHVYQLQPTNKQKITAFSRVAWHQRESASQLRGDVPMHEDKYEEQKKELWKCLPSWHISFFQPRGHAHVKVPLPSAIQVPPFWQGLLRHGSISEKEKTKEEIEKMAVSPLSDTFFTLSTKRFILLVNWSSTFDR